MYIPKHNLVTDRKEIVAFMKRYNFGVIISAKNNLPIATHLPFVISEEGDDVIIYGHYAKANKQWSDIGGNTVLVIFSEPHAYVSPKYYDHRQNVPTWNYMAVHVYGTAELVESRDGAIDILERSMDFFEPGYKEQWKTLDEEYKNGLLKGIVAFKIKATELQAKKKLSQNRNETERQRIIESFSQSHNPNEKEIAEHMRHLRNSDFKKG